MNNLRQIAEDVFLFGTATVSVGLGLGGLFGILPGPSRIPAISLGVLGVIVGYLATERRQMLERLEQRLEGLDQAVLALQGGPVRELKGTEELYMYLSQRLAQARHRLDFAAWGPDPASTKTQVESEAYDKYLSAKHDAAMRDDVTFRDLLTFPHLERLRRTKALALTNSYGYQLAYYTIDPEAPPPLLAFVLVDSEEVILAFYGGPHTNVKNHVHLAIRHSRTVTLFQDYFDAAWQDATIVKRAGDSPNLELLTAIEDSFPGKNAGQVNT